jgi:histidyl-tRNA synthetase
MNKDQLGPLGGFRDLVGSPKYEVVARLRDIFESFGFTNLETPALERQEILSSALGEEANKQLYLFEDNGKRKIGLRYDLTLPLARFVAGNLGGLNLPFKRYEIGPVWRAEKPQKGRYRQFTQADVDIIGVESVSAEKEILEIVAAAQETLGNFTVQVNDRRIVTALLAEIQIPADQTKRVLQIIDKKLKISGKELADQLLAVGVTPNQLKQIQALFLSDSATLKDAGQLVGEELTADLQSLLDYARSINVELVYEPSMVRGLDYYTGPIFEGTFQDEPEYTGSVLAGGRYDNLVEDLVGKKIPAVGLSFGIDRIVDSTTEFIREGELFIVALPETEDAVRTWARELRAAGRSVEVYPDATVSMGAQIKYADKKEYTAVCLPFGDEWKQGLVVVKDLASGEQESLKRSDV